MLNKIFLTLVVVFFSANIFAQKNKLKIKKQNFPLSANFQVGNLASPKVPAIDFKLQKEITVAKPLKFVTCVVYFAGTGFPSVIAVTLNGENLSQISDQLNRCSSGTSIVFANIKVKGPDGIRTIDDVTYLLY